VRVNGLDAQRSVKEIVEHSLHRAALWDEVKDKLHGSALSLSEASSSAYALPARWPLTRGPAAG
jgi:ABC-type phosphate transport system ATPase subunit